MASSTAMQRAGRENTMTRHTLPAFAGVDFDRGMLFRSADLDETRMLCGRVFNPHELRIVGKHQRLQARMDHLRLGPISLNRLSWGAGVAVDPDRLASYYLISMPVRGHARFDLGGRVTDVSPHCMAVVNASQRFHFVASEDFEQIVVRIERAAIEAAWQALCGLASAAPPDFDCALPVQGAAWRALEPVMRLIARSAQGDCGNARPALLHARLEDLLASTLLLNQPHTHAPDLGGRTPRALPSHLRRAEEYMRAHLAEPLSLLQVARASGVPARTLQAAFQDVHGQGPMQWLREQRLHAVRDALLRARAGDRPAISELALRSGFTHFGEFSRGYRRRFGETPSSTLARARD